MNETKDSIKDVLNRPANTVQAVALQAVVVNSMLNQISEVDEEENEGDGDEVVKKKDFDTEYESKPVSIHEQQKEREEQLVYIQEV